MFVAQLALVALEKIEIRSISPQILAQLLQFRGLASWLVKKS